MGPADNARNGGIKKFRASETSNRKRRPGFEFRDRSAVGKQRSRRIRQSARESGQPRRAVARRTRKRGSLRREDQLRVKLGVVLQRDRKSTRLNSSHPSISYAVFCLEKKTLTVEDEWQRRSIGPVLLRRLS